MGHSKEHAPPDSPSSSTGAGRASMGTGHLPCRAECSHRHVLCGNPFAPLNGGIPGEPGVTVQSEPPSVGQQEAPGEETEKGLREARREGTKGRKAPEGSEVGRGDDAPFPPRSRDWKASKPYC